LTTIREYVKDNDEFKKLASTRIHWTIRRLPIRGENGGGKVILTGEENLILSVTSLTNEGHVLFLEISYGAAYPDFEEYPVIMGHICEDVKTNFPEATEGAWSNGN